MIYANTVTANVGPTLIIDDSGTDMSWIFSLYLYTTAPSLLGMAAITVRWHDGVSAKSESLSILLNLLVTHKSVCFPVRQGNGTQITIEATISGTGAGVGIACGANGQS